MIRAAIILALIALPLQAQQDPNPIKFDHEAPIDLPSGLTTQLQEMLWDRPGWGLVYRFRFVSPKFTHKNINLDVITADLEHLCAAYALPRIADIGPNPNQVIISIADKPSEFGIYDPGISQVFEAYAIEDETCIWEEF